MDPSIHQNTSTTIHLRSLSIFISYHLLILWLLWLVRGNVGSVSKPDPQDEVLGGTISMDPVRRLESRNRDDTKSDIRSRQTGRVVARELQVIGNGISSCSPGDFANPLHKQGFRQGAKQKHWAGNIFFILFTLVSFGLTWYHMVAFYRGSYLEWRWNSTPISVSDDSEGALLISRSFLPTTLHHHNNPISPAKNHHRPGMISLITDLSQWLSSVHLFADAYQIVISQPSRWWWSQQIFLSALPWGIFVGYEGGRRGIRHLWAYVLLGQMVAMSVAGGLFFQAVIRSENRLGAEIEKVAEGGRRRDSGGFRGKLRAEPSKNKYLEKDQTQVYTPPPSFLFPFLFISLVISYLAVSVLPLLSYSDSSIPGPISPSSWRSDSRIFLCALLIPHIQLFLPALLIPFYLRHPQAEIRNHYLAKYQWEKQEKSLYILSGALSLICHLRSTYVALRTSTTTDLPIHTGIKEVSGVIAGGGYGGMVAVLASIWDHPAVTSVSFDVLLFWVGCAVWRGLRVPQGGHGSEDEYQNSLEKKRDNGFAARVVDKEGIAWALAVMAVGGLGLNGAVAFRR